MKRTLVAGVGVLALLAGCDRTDSAREAASEAVNATQDAASVPVGQVSATTMANTTEGFVTALATSDIYEIRAADIALSKTVSTGTTELATRIKRDHTASSEQLKAIVLAEAAGTTLPTSLDQRRQGLIDNLNAAAPAEFERVYLTQQIAAHNEALTLLTGFRDRADTPRLVALATEIIPKVTAHRDRAQALLDAL